MARLRRDPSSAVKPSIPPTAGCDDKDVVSLRKVIIGASFDECLDLYRTLWHRYAGKDGATSKLHELLDASLTDKGGVPTRSLECIATAHLARVKDVKVGAHIRALMRSPWCLDILTLWAIFGDTSNKTRWPSSRFLAGLRDYADTVHDFPQAMRHLNAARWLRLDRKQDALLRRTGKQRHPIKDWEIHDVRDALEFWIDEDPTRSKLSRLSNRRNDCVTSNAKALKKTTAGMIENDVGPSTQSPQREERSDGADHISEQQQRRHGQERALEEAGDQGQNGHGSGRSGFGLPVQDQGQPQSTREEGQGYREQQRHSEEAPDNGEALPWPVEGNSGLSRPDKGHRQRPAGEEARDNLEDGFESGVQGLEDDDHRNESLCGSSCGMPAEEGHEYQAPATGGIRQPVKEKALDLPHGTDDDGYQSAEDPSLAKPCQDYAGHYAIGGDGDNLPGESQRRLHQSEQDEEYDCDGSHDTSSGISIEQRRAATSPDSTDLDCPTTDFPDEPDLDFPTIDHLTSAEQLRRDTFDTTFFPTSTPKAHDHKHFTHLPRRSSPQPPYSRLAMTTRAASKSLDGNPAKRQRTEPPTESPADMSPAQMQWSLDLWLSEASSPAPPALQHAVQKHRNLIEAAAVGPNSTLYIVLTCDDGDKGEEGHEENEDEISDKDNIKDRGLLVICTDAAYLWVRSPETGLLEDEYEQILPAIKSLLPNQNEKLTLRIRHLPAASAEASLSTRIAATVIMLVTCESASCVEDVPMRFPPELAADWQRYVELGTSLSKEQDKTLSFFDPEVDDTQSPAESPKSVESQAALSAFYTSRMRTWTLRLDHLRKRAVLATYLHGALSSIAKSANRTAARSQNQARPKEIVNAEERIERFREMLQGSAGIEREHMERAMAEMEQTAKQLRTQHAGTIEKDSRIARARKTFVYSLAIAKAAYEQDASHLEKAISSSRKEWIAAAEDLVASAQDCLHLAQTYNPEHTST